MIPLCISNDIDVVVSLIGRQISLLFALFVIIFFVCVIFVLFVHYNIYNCLRLSFISACAEDCWKALKERENEPKLPEPEPEPTTEVLFLCSYEGCGKTFIDVGALRKHSHIHGERHYICHYEGCGKVSCIFVLLILM